MRLGVVFLLVCSPCTMADGPRAPEIAPGEPATLPAKTAVGLPTISGFTVNSRIQPRGLPATWQVEYGRTVKYGKSTPPRRLPGRLAAHFAEDWTTGANGWMAGMSGKQLTHHARGGPENGAFLRYTDDQAAGNDVNHVDGIGIIHLGPYAYLGHFVGDESPPLFLGGGSPDLRGAEVSVDLRGVDWQPRGAKLGSWIQGYRDHSVVEVLPLDSRYPNWAFTGASLEKQLASGKWERAKWVLQNRTESWTFAGANGGRLLYDYGELDALLGGVNVNFFLFQILNLNVNRQPTGSIDCGRFKLTYRQHSLCAPSNGAKLLSAPPDSRNVDHLTDGWRNGEGREWRSQDRPKEPQTFVYSFETPITVWSINLHNASQHPSKDVEVAVSEDGGDNWVTIAQGELPSKHKFGNNFCFYHKDAYTLLDGVAIWAPLHPKPVSRLRVQVLSGHQSEAWGLGEIEAFGTGAAELTEDDWYDANQDVLVPSGDWHYRVSITTSGGTSHGPDQEVTVP